MMALIQKDLMIIQKQMKVMLGLFCLMIIVSYSFQNVAFFSTFIVFIMMQVMTAFTYDDMSNWGRFANTMPVKMHQHILSKYVLALILTGIGLVFSLPLLFIGGDSILNDKKAASFILLGILTLCLILFSIVLPVFIKLGPNMGRIILVAIFLLPTFVYPLVDDYFNWTIPSMKSIETFIYFAPIGGLLIMVISYLLSVQIYVKKEF